MTYSLMKQFALATGAYANASRAILRRPDMLVSDEIVACRDDEPVIVVKKFSGCVQEDVWGRVGTRLWAPGLMKRGAGAAQRMT